MKRNVMTHRTSVLLLAAGVLCLGSVSTAGAEEYGNDPNSSAGSSIKPLAGDEIINAENRPAMDQDKEISLKMTPETPISSTEPSTSTRETPETLSQYMLDLVENQNAQAALGF